MLPVCRQRAELQRGQLCSERTAETEAAAPATQTHLSTSARLALNKGAVKRQRGRPVQVSVCLRRWEPTLVSGELFQI